MQNDSGPPESYLYIRKISVLIIAVIHLAGPDTANVYKVKVIIGQPIVHYADEYIKDLKNMRKTYNNY